MESYYRLHCQTRRRHGLPPQPFKLFAAIQEHVLAPGLGCVITALDRARPIAAAVFMQFGGKALYKFGASDFKYQHLRGNNLVMWEAIRWFASRGCSRLHFGRNVHRQCWTATVQVGMGGGRAGDSLS